MCNEIEEIVLAMCGNENSFSGFYRDLQFWGLCWGGVRSPADCNDVLIGVHDHQLHCSSPSPQAPKSTLQKDSRKYNDHLQRLSKISNY